MLSDSGGSTTIREALESKGRNVKLMRLIVSVWTLSRTVRAFGVTTAEATKSLNAFYSTLKAKKGVS